MGTVIVIPMFMSMLMIINIVMNGSEGGDRYVVLYAH